MFLGRFAVESNQERAHPGNAHVPGQLGHVPHTGLLPQGGQTEIAEARVALLRVGLLRLQRINNWKTRECRNRQFFYVYNKKIGSISEIIDVCLTTTVKKQQEATGIKQCMFYI